MLGSFVDCLVAVSGLIEGRSVFDCNVAEGFLGIDLGFAWLLGFVLGLITVYCGVALGLFEHYIGYVGRLEVCQTSTE